MESFHGGVQCSWIFDVCGTNQETPRTASLANNHLVSSPEKGWVSRLVYKVRHPLVFGLYQCVIRHFTWCRSENTGRQ